MGYQLSWAKLHFPRWSIHFSQTWIWQSESQMGVDCLHVYHTIFRMARIHMGVKLFLALRQPSNKKSHK